MARNPYLVKATSSAFVRLAYQKNLAIWPLRKSPMFGDAPICNLSTPTGKDPLNCVDKPPPLVAIAKLAAAYDLADFAGVFGLMTPASKRACETPPEYTKLSTVLAKTYCIKESEKPVAPEYAEYM
jgi:hypothetical protein